MKDRSIGKRVWVCIPPRTNRLKNNAIEILEPGTIVDYYGDFTEVKIDSFGEGSQPIRFHHNTAGAWTLYPSKLAYNTAKKLKLEHDKREQEREEREHNRGVRVTPSYREAELESEPCENLIKEQLAMKSYLTDRGINVSCMDSTQLKYAHSFIRNIESQYTASIGFTVGEKVLMSRKKYGGGVVIKEGIVKTVAVDVESEYKGKSVIHTFINGKSKNNTQYSYELFKGSDELIKANEAALMLNAVKEKFSAEVDNLSEDTIRDMYKTLFGTTKLKI